MAFTFLAPYETYLRSLIRIMAAFTFTQHGVQKTFGWLGGMDGHGATAPNAILTVAGLLETIGGPLILLGLFTRPVAFLLSGEMAVGYFRTHAPRNFWPVINGGEITVFYCFFFLWLASADPGVWSLDHLLFRKKSQGITR